MFANLLAEEGMVYENSLFSRWQSGERIPRDRKTIVAIVTVFAKNGGIRNIEQANDILQSADQLPLTKTEHTTISSHISSSRPSANELIEYDNVQSNIPTQAIDLLNLTVSAMNHTIGKSSEAKAMSVLSKLGGYLQNIKVNRSISFLTSFFFVLILWYVGLQTDQSKTTFSNSYFGLSYALLAMFGGIFGIGSAYRWGGIKSSMGRALFYLSSGLLTWGFGNVVWTFYVLVLNVDVPYPSLADLFYIISWPLWGAGLYYLGTAAGIKFKLRSKSSLIPIATLPLLMIAFSYYLIIVLARGGVFIDNQDLLKTMFDLAYPFLDAIIVAEIFLIFGLTFKQVQKRYRTPLTFLLLGILTNYVADFMFSYSTTNGTFYDGSVVDMLFASAMFFIAIGTNSFDVS